MLDNKGFDLWADGYDKSVNLSEESNEYPFAGYKNVLNDIYTQVRQKEYAEILDIGFGTGIITTRLYDLGYKITGVDFSDKMIGIAQQKMPGAALIKWDFSKDLPEEIINQRFDYIVSTYALHHLTDTEKIHFINSITHMLKPNGKILIGDVSFETRTELEECKENYFEFWDSDEVYFVAEEMIDSLNHNLVCNYNKISHCAGILTLSVS
ncbi:MAG: methyltransferase [Herbinix sp.]|jgi:putative AdoMet-dependent methyltransferase|nr:methyltransferase [Herbinix sp.]